MECKVGNVKLARRSTDYVIKFKNETPGIVKKMYYIGVGTTLCHIFTEKIKIEGLELVYLCL